MPITTTTTSRPDIPLPAGFDVIDDWDGASTLIGTDAKEVSGTDLGIMLAGRQLADGSLVAARVSLVKHCSSPIGHWGQCLELTPSSARQLARDLVAGADALDGHEAQR